MVTAAERDVLLLKLYFGRWW